MVEGILDSKARNVEYLAGLGENEFVAVECIRVLETLSELW